jgi:hypothetical protein
MLIFAVDGAQYCKYFPPHDQCLTLLASRKIIFFIATQLMKYMFAILQHSYETHISIAVLNTCRFHSNYMLTTENARNCLDRLRKTTISARTISIPFRFESITSRIYIRKVTACKLAQQSTALISIY